MNFNDKLKELRSEKGFTAAQVAVHLEITRACYSMYEQGRRQPDFNTLIKIAKFFDVTTDYLLGLVD